METITITLPSKLAAHARSIATLRQQKLPDFIQSELQRVLAKKAGGRIGRVGDQLKEQGDLRALSDQEVMRLANLRMEKWQALQMHRLIHLAGARELTSEEQKVLDTLLEIHNEIGIKKALGISEAIRRGLLPPMSDPYWNAPPRRKLMPRKKK
jgi:hypothetical protein